MQACRHRAGAQRQGILGWHRFGSSSGHVPGRVRLLRTASRVSTREHGELVHPVGCPDGFGPSCEHTAFRVLRPSVVRDPRACNEGNSSRFRSWWHDSPDAYLGLSEPAGARRRPIFTVVQYRAFLPRPIFDGVPRNSSGANGSGRSVGAWAWG